MLDVSMGHCLRTAYELVGPAWLDPPTESEYDVVAKLDRPVTPDQIKAMLRTLLAARFQLRVHREKRDLPVYALVTTRPSPAIRRSTSGDKPKLKSCEKAYQTIFVHFSMPQFALQLGPPWTARPVIGRTNLDGSFDFELGTSHYVLDDSGKPILYYRGAIDMEGALIGALPEQLGLALKPQRSPYDVLVVGHVEKIPSAN
jgi:uncharacterized protein (TIGR03435 family)